MKRLPQTHPCQFLMVASFPVTTLNQSLSQSRKLEISGGFFVPYFIQSKLFTDSERVTVVSNRFQGLL